VEVSLEVFFGWQTVLFGLGVYTFSVTLRKLLEGLFNKFDLAHNYYWRSVLLPVLPPLIGVVWGALPTKYPYPEVLSGRMGHAVFGLVCGFFSSLIYRVVKSLMVKKWGIQIEEAPVSSGNGSKPGGAGSS
jgi:hypothetical protein